MLTFPNYVIHNIITTADLRQRVELKVLNTFPWGRYDNEIYGGKCGYVKNQEIPGRVTVFFSGKLISTGAKSVEQSKKQLETTKKLLVSVDLIKETAITPMIRNILATTDWNKKIDLFFLAKRLIGSRLHPQLFPGLTVKTKFGTTCIIFSTGKIVVVGAKSEQDIEKTIKNLRLS